MAFLPFVPSLVYEGIQVVQAANDDWNYGTTRNSSEQFFGCCAGGAAAVGGGMVGKSAGTAIGSAVGGPVGGFVGAIAGEVIGASVACVLADDAAKDRASKFFDKKDYDIRIYRCKSCGKRFKCRIYTRQSRKICKKCNDEDFEF